MTFVLMAVLIMNAAAIIISSLLICVPLQSLWDPAIPGKCINIKAWYRWESGPDVVIDMFMLILPLPLLWKLQTSRAVKLGLSLTFLTGSV